MRKTVFLDLGNVLIDVDKGVAAREIAAATGLDASALFAMVDSGLERDYERGLIGTAEYLSRLNKRLSLPRNVGSRELVALWKKAFLLDGDVLDIVRKLRRRCAVFLLSNTNPIHVEAVEEKYNLLRHFDGCVLSYETGFRKPERGIYERALALARADPGDALFIDDLEENVAGAKAAGIRGLRFVDARGLRAFLRAEGLLDPGIGPDRGGRKPSSTKGGS